MLIACSYNGQIVKNSGQGTQPKINWSGAFIHGSSNDIVGLVHIAEVIYEDSSFWSQGKLTVTGIYLSVAERENLRRYLVGKGGFLFVDDSSRKEGEFYRSIRMMLEEVLPAYPIEPIPDDHEIYSCFYRMGGAPVGMNSGSRPL